MKVSEIPYERPDVDQLIKDADEFCKAFNRARSAKTQYVLLMDYFRKNEMASTMFSLAYIRYSQNTKDEFYKAENDFMDENMPRLSVAGNKVSKTVLKSRYLDELKTMIPPVWFKNLEIDAAAMDKKILALSVKDRKKSSAYSELMSGLTVKFRGETLTPAGLGKYYQNPNRSIRKGAFTAYGKLLRKNGKKLDKIYADMVKIRTEMGKKMGYENYIPLGYLRMGRNCYDANDVARLRANILKYIVPLATKIRNKQKETLKVDQLYLYDKEMFTRKEPKPVLSVDEIFSEGIKMYDALNPETGKLMHLMVDSEAFDVLAREGKWGGGYCTELAAYKLPFILANFNGSADDLGTLTHEFGHALAAYESFNIPYPMLRQGGMETCEVHSMSMELFTYPYMKPFFGKNINEYYTAHLSSAVTFLPYGTLVDAFQHEAYAHPDMTPAERNRTWLRLWHEFLPDISLEGIPGMEDGRQWQRQAHIFESPFYYIDYVIAQITALEFFALSGKDYDKAFATYLEFLKKGGTDSYLGLVKAAGLKSPFEEETFPEICRAVEEKLGL